jgi:Spy/CpxP family protein refolding chaperone
MKAVPLVAIGMALVIGSAAASAQAAPQAGVQPPRGAGAARGRHAQQLANIDLTAEQKAKLEAISAKYADENRATRDAMAADPAAAMKKMMAIRDRMLPEIRAVLSVEQRAIFDKNIAEMTTRMNAMARPPAI